jgi:hypothetical protein
MPVTMDKNNKRTYRLTLNIILLGTVVATWFLHANGSLPLDLGWPLIIVVASAYFVGNFFLRNSKSS